MTWEIGNVRANDYSPLRGNDGKHGLLRADALAMTTRTDRHPLRACEAIQKILIIYALPMTVYVWINAPARQNGLEFLTLFSLFQRYKRYAMSLSLRKDKVSNL
jgi:hypothetical protein